ncbi:ABC transporter permease [Bifidobacterium eulemuris]|uniref:ABC transporter permease n=1 Tax=Bifidobacterium eulemuris TaxID=1765219 RepID=A0A261G9T2_9BIFI|nr:ABC transporter permease [Bifidobacterium eulemuris]OZG68170.1 peptide ABC transporter permease [Bifidobacterium eulemuris]QOL31771.1 ABC transporter permease [Bifidobacterium eulemuris]
MRFGDILRLCRQNLFRRKSRTILTVLGVVVGCCSIVLMVSIGQGINEQNERMLESMGDLSIITVYAGGGSSGGSSDSGGTGESAKLDDEAVESFRSIAGVSGATPMADFFYSASASAGAGGRYTQQYISVMGIDTTQLDQMGYELLDGRAPLKSGEVLVGEYTAYDFIDRFASEMNNMRSRPGEYICDENGCQENEGDDPFFDPLTTTLQLTTGVDYDGGMSGTMNGMGGGATGGSSGASATQTVEYTPVGVLKEDYNKGYTTSSGIIMSLDDLKKLTAKIDPSSAEKSTTYNQVLVKTADLSDVPEVEAQIKAMGFNTSSYEEIRKSIEEQSRGIQLALGGIGAVAFFVAAIGIANTMIMSVAERTREIGIMKALGCYVRDIRVMFLGEAGAIGLFGGLVGCVISGLVSWGINIFALGGPTPDNLWHAIVGGEDVTRVSVIPWWLFLAAVLFSMLVGVIAGFGPANKAVRIPALDAIKNSE